MDKKTQALVEQYARSLVEVAFEQDAVSTIQEEVRQILTVFAETNLKTFLSQENVTSEAKKESLDFKFSSFTFSVGLSSTQSAINTLVSLGLD